MENGMDTTKSPDSSPPLCGSHCIEVLKDFMDGLPQAERIINEQHLCQELYNGWTESDQLRFIKQILYKLNPSQRVQMLDFQIQLDLRDFISLLATYGMNHIAKTILSYLDAESLRAAELVSKEWQRMISGERSWKAFIERKVRTDSTWHKLSAHREWVQHLFTPQPDKTHNFYRSLHLRFQNEITRIENNWRNGLYKLTKINCGSNQAKGVYCIQYDADKIVAGLRENTIKIWDRNSLMCTNTLNGHTGSVLCLQFDDKVIISGSSDTTIRTWDIRTGALLKTCIHHEDAVLHLKFEKGIMISCSKDRSVIVWDVTPTYEIEFRCVIQGHRAAVNVVDFDEKYIVSASGDRLIKVWRLPDAQFIHTLRGHERGIACLQFRGELVVSGSSDKTIRIWNIESGECIRVLVGHEDLVRCIRFDSKRIVSGAYDGKIKIWDLVAALDSQSPDSALCMQTLQEHRSKLFRLQFDEFHLVTSSHDDTILIWDFLNDAP